MEVLLTIAMAPTGGGFEFCPGVCFDEGLTHFSMALDFFGCAGSGMACVISLGTVLL